MRRIVLAIGTVAMGLAGTGTAVYAQTRPESSPQSPPQSSPQAQPQSRLPSGPQAQSKPQSRSRVNYSLYGGPSDSQSGIPQTRGVEPRGLGPIYKMYGVPDEITAADKAREARRDAAVEFGMYRRQFTGSTEFWMDYDRTRLAKVRYSMDESMWSGLHPLYDFGDGGYMYNTAVSAAPLSTGSAATTPAPIVGGTASGSTAPVRVK